MLAGVFENAGWCTKGLVPSRWSCIAVAPICTGAERNSTTLPASLGCHEYVCLSSYQETLFPCFVLQMPLPFSKHSVAQLACLFFSQSSLCIGCCFKVVCGTCSSVTSINSCSTVSCSACPGPSHIQPCISLQISTGADIVVAVLYSSCFLLFCMCMAHSLCVFVWTHVCFDCTGGG